ncbi:MAG: exo-alpha-sialidase [Clostridiaceae bacterium]|nr:exo-alpha-sialidase [Clostridiaceae bacterium]
MKSKCKILKGKEYIFENNRPFLSCHASTLVELDNGDTLAAWFGGTAEKNPDTAIWHSRRKDGKWSYPEVLADEKGIALWNPVLFNAPDGRIFLYYKVGENTNEWHTKYIISSDNGISWTDPGELVPGDIGGRGPVKNKPVVLHDGTWLAPASVESKYWDSFVDITADGGRTWTAASLVPINHGKFCGKGVIQPTIWESEPNRVHMLLRSTSGRIYRSDSEDGGRTWCEIYETSLPNNNSGIDAAKLDDGSIALVYNPVGKNWGPRTPLVVSLSKDNGTTWPYTCVLEYEEGEYSYPAIVARGDEISITYTWKRERIAYVRCTVEDILACREHEA